MKMLQTASETSVLTEFASTPDCYVQSTACSVFATFLSVVLATKIRSLWPVLRMWYHKPKAGEIGLDPVVVKQCRG